MTFPIMDEPFVPAGTEDDPMEALRVLRARAQDALRYYAAHGDSESLEVRTFAREWVMDSTTQALNMALSILGLSLVESA